jgi:hypothetical protein
MELLLSNGLAKNHVPIETIEPQQRNNVFYVARAEML